MDLWLDSLTGLPNMITLVNDLRELPSGKGALILADLTDLAGVNASYGRDTGDKVIQAMADAFAGPCAADPGRCRPYRTGGDDIIVVLEEADRVCVEDLLAQRVERLRTELESRGLPAVEVRVAAACYPEQGSSLAALLARLYGGIRPPSAQSRGHRWVEGVLGWFIGRLIDTLDELGRTRELALTDPISGLPNYRAVQDVVERAVRQYERNQGMFSVLFVDGDNLKLYNERLGYDAGNRMIQYLGRLLREGLRAGDFVGRWLSGDEFLAILPRTDRETALAVGERLRGAVEAASTDWTFPVTVSVGVATCPDDSTDADDLLNRAARANALAKQGGKNRVAVAPQADAEAR